MKGRKPKPTHLKLVAGNPGKRPLNEAEPKPKGNLNDPPGWFSDEQRAIWLYAIEHAPPGLLKRLDASVLVVWVVAAEIHQRAALLCRDELTTVTPEKGVVIQSPHLSIVNRQATIMMRAAAELGFTPASRSRVRVGEDAPDDDGNPFARWQGR
jgi:P27 family predicted phage terminase small subunit